MLSDMIRNLQICHGDHHRGRVWASHRDGQRPIPQDRERCVIHFDPERVDPRRIRGGFLPNMYAPLRLRRVYRNGAHSLPPVVRHFPSWFPGTYYVERARKTRLYMDRLYDYPLADVRQKMVGG
jgi:hypothetical protein